MNDFTEQREAIRQLQDGNPGPASQVLASDKPLTPNFRQQLAIMLAPQSFPAEASELPCWLVLSRRVGRPRASKANAIWTYVICCRQDDLTLQQAIGKTADKFKMTDHAVRNIYNRVQAKWREEYYRKSAEEWDNPSADDGTEEDVADQFVWAGDDLESQNLDSSESQSR